jgi:hypothetical protein
MLLSFNFLFEAAAILQQLLCGFLIVPEIWRRGLALDVLQLLAACRDIKETSRAGLHAHASRQTKLSVPESIKCRSS